MKLELTNQQLLSLMALISNTINKYKLSLEDNFNDQRGTTEAKREIAIFEELLLLMAKKALLKQVSYKFKIRPYMALTFHLEYSGLMNETDYLGNVVQSICNKIDKYYQNVF